MMNYCFVLLLIPSSLILSSAREPRREAIKEESMPEFEGGPQQSTRSYADVVKNVPASADKTNNVFAQGGIDTATQGSVAHALGQHGVRKHLQNLQTEAKSEWEANFAVDYSLTNYKKAVAEMTKKCLEMMEAMREEMTYETSTIVNKEVDRVWPALEMQEEIKHARDLDVKDGLRGPWYIDKTTGQKVDQSFLLQSYYPKKEFWRNYLENQLHRADHEVMSNGINGEYKSSGWIEGGSNKDRMMNGQMRPSGGSFSGGDAQATTTTKSAETTTTVQQGN